MPRREEAEVEFLQPLLLRRRARQAGRHYPGVYVQENVGWEWGLGVPIVAMLVAVTAFMWGNPLYVNMAPGGSPCTRLAQVLDTAISTAGRLLRTNQLR